MIGAAVQVASGGAVTLLQSIVGGFIGIAVSLGMIKLMIWKGNKETRDELKLFEISNEGQHKEIFEKLDTHNVTIDSYNSNRAFYKSLEKLAQDGANTVEEETEENPISNSNNKMDIGCLIQVLSESIKEFAKDVLLIGINEVSDESVTSKINVIKAKIRAKCDRVLGTENAKEFRRKTNPILIAYARDVRNISADICNDKDGSFKDITKLFTRKMISQVIRFGFRIMEKNKNRG